MTSVLTLPEGLRHRLTHLLRSAALRREQIDALQTIIKNDGVPDYGHAAEPFAYLYSGANYAKAFRAVSELASGHAWNSLNVLDLGCGHGASVAGTVAALAAQGVSVERIVAVDRSSHQLKLFDDGVRQWLLHDHPWIRVDVVHADVWQYAHFGDDCFDLVVASYVLCEMSDGPSFEAALRAQNRFSEILTIDSNEAGRPCWRSNDRSGMFERELLHIDLSALSEAQLGEPKFNRRVA